jgi:hypothetical protein
MRGQSQALSVRFMSAEERRKGVYHDKPSSPGEANITPKGSAFRCNEF